jgi:hypothetical protein
MPAEEEDVDGFLPAAETAGFLFLWDNVIVMEVEKWVRKPAHGQ